MARNKTQSNITYVLIIAITQPFHHSLYRNPSITARRKCVVILRVVINVKVNATFLVILLHFMHRVIVLRKLLYIFFSFAKPERNVSSLNRLLTTNKQTNTKKKLARNFEMEKHWIRKNLQISVRKSELQTG